MSATLQSETALMFPGVVERTRSGQVRHPRDNKFHAGNKSDGKHYWLTPPDVYAALDAEFAFDFDPCPFPLPDGFDGLTCEWGQSNYVNPPFGSIVHEGKKKGPTAWVRKALAEHAKGKRVVLVYPIDKWVLMLMASILGDRAQVRNLGDVKWLATEDGSAGKGTGRHIACFILEPKSPLPHDCRSVTVVAHVKGNATSQNVTAANAQLLAASPDMLAALRTTLEAALKVAAFAMSSDSWNPESRVFPSFSIAELRAIAAAVAKAEGTNA